MPPCNVTNKDEASVEYTRGMPSKLQLAEIRKALPDSVFQKSAFKTAFYMITDYVMWFGTVYAMYRLCNSSTWTSMSQWQQIIASIIYFNVAGLFMWCVFMIGHDCGHTVFSDYTIVNDFFGHVTHGSLMVPFYPWQLSHRRHHMYHNHIDKDYSFPWFTEEVMAAPDSWLARIVHDTPALLFFFPFYGWFLYTVVGKADGCHFIPFPQDRLWKDSPMSEYIKCLFSSFVVYGLFYAVYLFCGQSFSTMAFYYGGPWVMFGWWLVCVTYLQHHDPTTLAYDDSNWTFVDAAFETVDRTYGFFIDSLTHHITDGHVVHHLFFTKIPHYNLPTATKALTDFLKEKNLLQIYRFDRTYDFPYRLHSYLLSNGLRAVSMTDFLKTKDLVTSDKKLTTKELVSEKKSSGKVSKKKD